MLFAKLNLQPGIPALDTCTGTGDLALSIAKHAPEGVDVVGSDFCNAMLEIARDKRLPPKDGVKPVEFIEADSQSLPFANDMFSALPSHSGYETSPIQISASAKCCGSAVRAGKY